MSKPRTDRDKSSRDREWEGQRLGSIFALTVFGAVAAGFAWWTALGGADYAWWLRPLSVPAAVAGSAIGWLVATRSKIVRKIIEALLTN